MPLQGEYAPSTSEWARTQAEIYEATDGREAGTLRDSGLPVIVLTSVGAKSGIERTAPLVYVEDGPDLAIVASKGGFPKHPAWFHNLKANPNTTVQVGSEKRAVHARVATPEERERLWAKAVAVYSGYTDYQRRAEREIPIVILEPRPAS